VNDKESYEAINRDIPIKEVIAHLTDKSPRKDKIQCPLPGHVDNDPSFQIYTEDNTWWCFGCDSGSSVIDFVMEYKQIDFKEAVKLIADKYGISIDERENYQQKREEREKIYEILDEFTELCHKRIDKAKLEGKTVRNYIKEKRGFEDETIDGHQIGFCDEKVKSKLKSNFDLQNLMKAGVFQEKEGSANLIYQNRIVFPYIYRGHTVYTIGRKTEKTPDYSKPKYKKHLVQKEQISDFVQNQIFGLDRPLEDRVLITEGITDCISLREAGFSSISPVTTRFKRDDLEQIVKHLSGKEVYLIPDNELSDEGIKGAIDTQEYLKKEGIEAKIVFLPLEEEEEKIDVDEFTKGKSEDEVKEEIENLLEEAKDYIDIKLDEIEEKKEEDVIRDILQKNIDARPLEREKLFKRLKDDGRVSINKKETFKKEMDIIEKEQINKETKKEKDEDSTDKGVNNPNQEPTEKELKFLKDGRLLCRVLDKIHHSRGKRGLVGEDKNALYIYLCSLSCKGAEEPVNLFVMGPTCEGKSTLATSVKDALPSSMCESYAGASKTALRRMYDEETRDGERLRRIVNLEEKTLFFLEADNAEELIREMRPLFSHDEYEITYPITETIEGEIEIVEYVIRGHPSVVMLSTNNNFLGEEEKSRFALISPTTGRQKYKEITKHKIESKTFPFMNGGKYQEKDHISSAIEKLRKVNVVVPHFYQNEVEEYLPTFRGENLRMTDRFLSLVETITYLHQYQRPVLTIDGKEYLFSAKSDLIIASNLMAKELTGLDEEIMNFYTDVLKRLESQGNELSYDNIQNLAEELGYPRTRKTIRPKYINPLKKAGLLDSHKEENGKKIFDIDLDSKPRNGLKNVFRGRLQELDFSLDDLKNYIKDMTSKPRTRASDIAKDGIFLQLGINGEKIGFNEFKEKKNEVDSIIEIINFEPDGVDEILERLNSASKSEFRGTSKLQESLGEAHEKVLEKIKNTVGGIPKQKLWNFVEDKLDRKPEYFIDEELVNTKGLLYREGDVYKVSKGQKPRKGNKEKEKNILIRVEEDISEFVGYEINEGFYEDRNYDLQKEDVLTIPKTLGDCLIEQGKAKKIDSSLENFDESTKLKSTR